MKNLDDYLIEHIIIEDNKILENYGEVDIIRKSLTVIISKLLHNEYNINLNFKKLCNIVNINFTNSNKVYAAYDIDNTNMNEKTLSIDLSYDNLKFKNDKQYRRKVSKLIAHELLHYYEDKERYKSNTDSLNDILSSSYKNVFNSLSSSSKEINQISSFIYLLNNQEQHAYLSNLKSDIKEIIKDNNWNTENIKYDKFIECLKSYDIWKIYFSFNELISNVESNDLLYKTYCDITNQHMSKDKVISKMKFQFNKFKNKFDTLVPKILFEVLPVKHIKTKSITIDDLKDVWN